jgi:ubiquinone/menaquinone biosynthesis C-methylase UbiE
VLFTNARNMGFPTASFDIALCGFMGWDDCFDFVHLEFTQPDTKASEFWRVLRDGGTFVCCSWEEQEDLAWMEEAMLRFYPTLLQDEEYLQQRPIGMGYEKAQGYEIILRSAGFREIEISRETAEFVSTDEDEFWREMDYIGWDIFLKKIKTENADKLLRVKEAILKDLQSHKQSDGIHFSKTVFFISAVK